MRKNISGLILGLGVFMLISCEASNSLPKQCQFVYTFKNLSLGPKNGIQRVRLLVRDDQIISAIDTKTGKNLSLSSIKGKSYLLKAISHKNKGMEVRYNSDGFPVRITNIVDRSKIGGKFFIEISQYHCR